MRKRFDAFIPTLDQLISSATVPIFLLIGFTILPIESFAIAVLFVFLYGSLASICQAILGEPYLISSKHESRSIDSADYTSASLILAMSVTITTFPLSLLITESLKLSGFLLLPVLAMLLQDSKRIFLIANRGMLTVIRSDAVWFLASIIFLILGSKSGEYFLFIGWGIPGIIALLVILDYSDFHRINLVNGLRLLLHYNQKYFYTISETTLSGFSLLIAYWAISNYLGDSEVSLLRIAVILFGFSTVIINRQRVFDFANENIHQLATISYHKIYVRLKEIWRVVAFNLIFLFLILALSDLMSIRLFDAFPGALLLLAMALDRLSVGVLMAVSVFLKTHGNPRTLAAIRILVSVTSASIYFILALIGSNLLLLIVLGTLPYFVAFGLIYSRIIKASS